MYEPEASIGKALQGEAIVNYASLLVHPPGLSGSRWPAGNAAHASLRLALWVKSDEKKKTIARLNSKTSFSLIFMRDSGNNWAAAMGQSAYYGLQTGKKAGIVLILETLEDRKYWILLNTSIESFNFPIDIWSIEITGILATCRFPA